MWLKMEEEDFFEPRRDANLRERMKMEEEDF